MRLPLLLPVGALLLALLPCAPCGVLLIPRPGPGARAPPPPPQPQDVFQSSPRPQEPGQQQPGRPVLIRLGEEYFLRLGNPHKSSFAGGSSDEAAANFFRALLQPLDSRAQDAATGSQEAPARKRRSQVPPISLDLTFHLLREVLEMARAERLAQQAHRNRKLLDMVGK
ncbi:corticoliberin [Erinaceus europaeus]|uniref:Corticoliberin n=1 Tax=Erinaceus europaeus TaxID=9365 RepID=A0A1S3A0H1_ERIEU|nr:corticoliberin [Erinaceus europaeus]